MEVKNSWEQLGLSRRPVSTISCRGDSCDAKPCQTLLNFLLKKLWRPRYFSTLAKGDLLRRRPCLRRYRLSIPDDYSDNWWLFDEELSYNNSVRIVGLWSYSYFTGGSRQTTYPPALGRYLLLSGWTSHLMRCIWRLVQLPTQTIWGKILKLVKDATVARTDDFCQGVFHDIVHSQFDSFICVRITPL